MRISSILLVLVFFAVAAFSQKTVKVCGEYKYVAPQNISIEQARNIAIERARDKAMADEFGTIVSQVSTTSVKNSETSFNMYGGTESKGLWLGDDSEPEINEILEGGFFVINAKVCGKARELKAADVELKTTIFCNGIESEKFRDKDRFTIKFKSPVKGYLAIFLLDDNDVAGCLLPYQSGEAVAVKNNVEYVYLTTADPSYPWGEETILETEKDIEFFRIYFIFSKNSFAMPLTENGEYVPELPKEKFDKWLLKNRLKDEDMQVIQKVVEVRKIK